MPEAIAGVGDAVGRRSGATGACRRGRRRAERPPAGGGDVWGMRAAPAGVRAPAPQATGAGPRSCWPTTSVLPLRSGLSAWSSLVVVSNRAAMLESESPLWTTYFLVTAVVVPLLVLVALTVGVGVGVVRAHHAGLHDDADEGDDGDEEDDRAPRCAPPCAWSAGRRPDVGRARGVRLAPLTGRGWRAGGGPRTGRRPGPAAAARRRPVRRPQRRRAHRLQAPQGGVRVVRARRSRAGRGRRAVRGRRPRTASPLLWCLVGHRVSWRSLRIDSAAAAAALR